MDTSLRPARIDELAELVAVENSADAAFAALGIVFPPGPTVVETVAGQAEILVAGDPPAGFAAFRTVDGATHLEQISVRADLMGRGIGVPLLRAVQDRARAADSPGVTLITFRDVPWNAPWYARHGFAELPQDRWGPGLRAYWEAELEDGLHTLGPRLIMWSPSA
ncbi:GNAT family N-acetyltransferase [Spirillospora albida]|uniref:GNAT family N-acetyltransferase n=1 Tax=Spirillospora albida TaxID=58123 RepID=UPI0004C29C1A|nr:GNAT family N-acetyltransferase [Spirillospora albida]